MNQRASHKEVMERVELETQRRLKRGEGQTVISQCAHGENGNEEEDGRHEDE